MHDDPPNFAPGRVIAARYRIERSIGEGAFGAVFAATDLSLNRLIALKVLLPHCIAQADGLRRFQREARLAQQLQHPNTVRLHEFGVAEDGTPFIAWELLRGQTLGDLLRRGPLPAARVARIAAQILKSLMEAHALGIIHRDIKPANIFLCDSEGEPDFVKVLDFGIAKEMAGQGYTATGLTKPGQSLGTPSYMSPEQITGAVMSPAGDVYALGLVMAEALAGEVVFKGDSEIPIALAQLSNQPAPLGPEVLRSALGPVILRATQKSLERRFDSAAAMLAGIEEAMRASASTEGAGMEAAQPTMAIASMAAVTSAAPSAQAETMPTRAGSYVGPFAGMAAASAGYGSSPHGAAGNTQVRAPSGSTRLVPWIVAGVVLVLVGGGIAVFAVGAAGIASLPGEPGTTTVPAGNAPTWAGLKDLTVSAMLRALREDGWENSNLFMGRPEGFRTFSIRIKKGTSSGEVKFTDYGDVDKAKQVADELNRPARGVAVRDDGAVLFVEVYGDPAATQQVLSKFEGK